MKNRIVGIILALSCCITGSIHAQVQPPRLIGFTIWRDNKTPPEIHCRFLYRKIGSKGPIKIDATQFCNDNLPAVRALGKAAFMFARENPIDDPAVVKRIRGLQNELKQFCTDNPTNALCVTQ